MSHYEYEKKFLLLENQEAFVSPDFLDYCGGIPGIVAAAYEHGVPIEQGYLDSLGDASALMIDLNLETNFFPHAIRLRRKGPEYFLTIKGHGTVKRRELEIEISEDVFNAYWGFTTCARVSKLRHAFQYNGHNVELDLFTDRDLILAEIEVKTEEELATLPALGKDVSENEEYTNLSLARIVRTC